MPTRISIYDKGAGGLVPTCVSQAKEVFGAENVEAAELLQWNDPVAKLRECSYSLGHLTTDQFNALLVDPPPTLKMVIRVSSVGVGGMDSYRSPYRVTDNGPWIVHLIDRSGDLPEGQWKTFWRGIQQWNLETEPDAALALFFTADHVEELWALLALCEASQIASNDPDGPLQMPSDWLEAFDLRPRPGGLFDPKGILAHQRFMRARQSTSSSKPTVSEIADCLCAVIQELTALKQI